MKNIKPLFLSILLVACIFSNENLAPDQKIWNYGLPNQFGLINKEFINLDEAIRNDEFKNINALIIVKNDQLIFENYYLDQQSRKSVQ